jgi:hypothetical protein
VIVQRLPAAGIRVIDIHVNGSVERSQPRCERFGVEVDGRRQLVGPRLGFRIDDERTQAPMLVQEIHVRVVVRHEPADVRCDGRSQPGQVTRGDDRVRHVDQRPPVIALRLEVVGTGLT